MLVVGSLLWWILTNHTHRSGSEIPLALIRARSLVNVHQKYNWNSLQAEVQIAIIYFKQMSNLIIEAILANRRFNLLVKNTEILIFLNPHNYRSMVKWSTIFEYLIIFIFLPKI